MEKTCKFAWLIFIAILSVILFLVFGMKPFGIFCSFLFPFAKNQVFIYAIKAVVIITTIICCTFIALALIANEEKERQREKEGKTADILRQTYEGIFSSQSVIYHVTVEKDGKVEKVYRIKKTLQSKDNSDSK